MFAALGHLAYLNDTSVLDIPFGGFSLVFGTWPVVLGEQPSSGDVLLFSVLCCLAGMFC